MNKPHSDTAEGLAEGLSGLLARGFRFVRLRDAEVVSGVSGAHRL